MNPKIILVTGSAPPDPCGIGDYTASLATALESAGQQVEVLCHRDWSLAGTSKALLRLVAARRALVHMQYPSLGYGYSLGPQLCLLARRGIVTIHEFSLAHPLRKLSLFPFTLRSTCIVMTSQFEKTALVQRMPWAKNRIRVIPIGSNIYPHAVPQMNREQSVVYFGLITPRKGLEDFLEFARQVRKNNLNWELLAIGRIFPGQEAYAQSLMASLAACRVQLILDRSADEVSDLLSKAGLAYLPFPDGASERRGSLKAALAGGVPCITTSSAQTPLELAQSVMLATSPFEAVEIARRLMASETERSRLSQRATEYARQFAWETIAALHINMYRELDGAS
jgi:glycosyltransferase involved in cell wall biosynthesis